MARKQFFPEKVFSTDVSYNSIIPKVLNSPHKYIQSAGALNNLVSLILERLRL
jgi:hypothetical protein